MNKQLNLISILLLLLINSCANAQTQLNKHEIITISYSNEVAGYMVTAIWKPMKVSYNHVIGPAIIEFKNKKDSTLFNLTNNNFSILKKLLPFTYSEDSLEIKKINKKAISLVYNETKMNKNFGTTNQPFFFQDLDFDNKKELIITEVNNGQRGIASFKAYKIEYGEIESELYGITNTAPFKSLDEMSKIDYKNKQIIIYGSGGVCLNGAEIYKFQTTKNDYEDNKYILEFIVEEQRDDKLDKCFELVYKVINNSKQLISKKEIK